METRRLRPTQSVYLLLTCLFIAGLNACGHSPSATGPQKRMRLMVGEIKEISVAPADTALSLTGTSDNSEVVDVSAKQTTTGTAPATASGQSVFLIKGVTIGTARVVFTEKRRGETGDGQVRRAYVVQVMSK